MRPLCVHLSSRIFFTFSVGQPRVITVAGPIAVRKGKKSGPSYEYLYFDDIVSYLFLSRVSYSHIHRFQKISNCNVRTPSSSCSFVGALVPR